MKIVSVGGGTGQPVLLQGLKKLTKDITAVVTVADAGGSSGRLRKEHNIPPPGDIRNCLVALSKDPQLLHKLFQYRFENGSLGGHSFGNLFITALTKVTGDFEEAIAETSKILKITGKVLPASLDDHHLCAELSDGSVARSEPEVEDHGHSLVKRLYLEPPAKATEDVKQAILDADVIVLGPGSLYTSVLANLLVTGIPEAIKESKATVVYVCNIFTQPGETENMMAQDLVNEIEKYLGKDVLDVVLVNSTVPPQEVLDHYRADGAELVTGPVENVNVIEADLIPDHGTNPIIWAEKNWLRHDPDKLARVIQELKK